MTYQIRLIYIHYFHTYYIRLIDDRPGGKPDCAQNTKGESKEVETLG